MMMLTSTAFAQTEFDFDANGSSMFGLAGESSNGSNDGDITETKSATVGDFTVTVSAANEGTPNRIWNSAPKLRMYSGTLTVASAGASINKIVFTLASQASKAKWDADNSASTGTIDAAAKTSVTWTGSANKVVFTIAANTQISKITINGKTSGETPTDVTKAADIAAFKALADGTVAELTLTNALVTYKNVNGQNIELFIRDASGAMDLYNTGIEADAGQVLNGKIIGTRGVSSGFTYALKKSTATDASTVTVGAKQDVAPVEIASLDEATYDAYGCELVKITGVKIVGGKAQAGGDELALYDRFKTGLLSGLDEEKDYDVTGLIYDGGQTYGTELVVTALTLAEEVVIVDEPATPVASIEALLALESPASDLELTLTNAKVLFVDNNYIYMRENGKALCFYQINGLKDVAKNNAVVNGKIKVDYEVYKLLPEVKTNKNTNLDALTIEESEEEAEPVQTTLAEVAAGQNVCDLVTLKTTLVKEVTYKEDGVTVSTTTYYLQDGDTKILVVSNGKGLNKIEDGTMVTVTGIVNTANNAYQVKLTKTVSQEEPADDNEPCDVNKDGKVDVADIVTIMDKIAEKSKKGKAAK